MAIKTSWTAGEVLTAADLTDTLADKVDLTPSATQTITSGTATVKPLVIKAASSQTANLLEFQNSAGTPVRAVLPDGTITGQNLLYNGAMQVAQRSTSVASITTVGYYTADRWRTAVNTLGTWTQSVESDGPTGSGLTKSLKMLCTTADAAPAAGDYLWVGQRVEGQDLQRIAKGTASAQQITLSFWVKSNKTGTYVCLLEDQDNSRIVGATYTVSASATWEKKTITFPADTTGAFTNDNGTSLEVFFWLAGGSDWTSGTLPATWAAATAANYAPGQTNLAAATNNYWQVTGVQLEVGSVASAFEFKPFGQELRECQRYYYRSANASAAYAMLTDLGPAYSTTKIVTPVTFPVAMRTVPSALTTGGSLRAGDALNVFTPSAAALAGETTSLIALIEWTVSGATQWRHYWVSQNNDSTAFIALSAEL